MSTGESQTGRSQESAGGGRGLAVLQAFRIAALVEGTLLPAVVVLALLHSFTGAAASALAVVGASHGTVFTAYLLLLPLVQRILRWPPRTAWIAFIASLVPFAPWAFERQIRADVRRYAAQRQPGPRSDAVVR